MVIQYKLTNMANMRQECICSIILAFELDSLGNTECKIAYHHTQHKTNKHFAAPLKQTTDSV